MKTKKSYANARLGLTVEAEVELDETGHAPMFIRINGAEYKAVSEWCDSFIMSSNNFFASAHEYQVDPPPLERDERFAYAE
jgi:hypothetical protein